MNSIDLFPRIDQVVNGVRKPTHTNDILPRTTTQLVEVRGVLENSRGIAWFSCNTVMSIKRVCCFLFKSDIQYIDCTQDVIEQPIEPLAAAPSLQSVNSALLSIGKENAHWSDSTYNVLAEFAFRKQDKRIETWTSVTVNVRFPEKIGVRSLIVYWFDCYRCHQRNILIIGILLSIFPNHLTSNISSDLVNCGEFFSHVHSSEFLCKSPQILLRSCHQDGTECWIHSLLEEAIAAQNVRINWEMIWNSAFGFIQGAGDDNI